MTEEHRNRWAATLVIGALAATGAWIGDVVFAFLFGAAIAQLIFELGDICRDAVDRRKDGSP